MRVHHLDCGSMCPFGRRWVNGVGGTWERGLLCCHVLLLESDEGLVLVDTGFGTQDVADPVGRLGRLFVGVSQPRLRIEQTALHQIRRLGYAPSDVRDVVLTHGDLDHGGGLPDFPQARVHLHRDELDGIRTATGAEGQRYSPIRRFTDVRWVPHEVDGETWEGFEAVRPLRGTNDEVLLVPLPGHTRGHAAIAVQTQNGWLLHAGDAYFHRAQMAADPSIPKGLGVFQKLVDWRGAERRANQERLRQLSLARSPEVQVFCAHDPEELGRLRAQTGSGA